MLATSAYTPSIGCFGSRILAVYSCVVATKPLGAAACSRLDEAAGSGFADALRFGP
jgi:hypothetical protein